MNLPIDKKPIFGSVRLRSICALIPALLSIEEKITMIVIVDAYDKFKYYNLPDDGLEKHNIIRHNA